MPEMESNIAKLEGTSIKEFSLYGSLKILSFSISDICLVTANNFMKSRSCDGIYSKGLLTAAWLAQLVERQSAVREVEGSSPRLNQHSGS